MRALRTLGDRSEFDMRMCPTCSDQHVTENTKPTAKALLVDSFLGSIWLFTSFSRDKMTRLIAEVSQRVHFLFLSVYHL
jgi:hypothetical protein